jgi:hypothetical protein
MALKKRTKEVGPDLRLRVSPIPKPLFGINLRKIPKGGWGKIRQAAIQEHGNNCGTCGEKITNGLQGHEHWEYDTTSDPAIARIGAIVLQCRMCHDCEHFFRTLILVRNGAVSSDRVDELVQHFCRVNGVGPEEFNAHAVVAWNEWARLSALRWRVDFRPYSEQVVHADPVKGIEMLKPGSRLPWVDPTDHDRRSEFLHVLTQISTRYGYWIGSTSKSKSIPLHVMEPGQPAGYYRMTRIEEPTDEGMIFHHTLSWSDDPARKAKRRKS